MPNRSLKKMSAGQLSIIKNLLTRVIMMEFFKPAPVIEIYSELSRMKIKIFIHFQEYGAFALKMTLRDIVITMSRNVIFKAKTSEKGSSVVDDSDRSKSSTAPDEKAEKVKDDLNNIGDRNDDSDAEKKLPNSVNNSSVSQTKTSSQNTNNQLEKETTFPCLKMGYVAGTNMVNCYYANRLGTQNIANEKYKDSIVVTPVMEYRLVLCG